MKGVNMEIISDRGCAQLIEAVFWRAIVDVVTGWRRYHTELGYKLNQDVNYISAISFLRSTEKGKRIMHILDNLNEEQLSALLAKGGLSYSEYYYNSLKRSNNYGQS